MSNAQKVSNALDDLQEWVMKERLALVPLSPDFDAKYTTLKAVGAKIRALRAAPTPDAHSEVWVKAEPDFASSITEVMKEESLGGAACGWRSCTGCHETNEGYETGHYPYSAMFQTYVGSGCGECGGLGVVWEYWSESDLAAMAKEPKPDADLTAGAVKAEPMAVIRFNRGPGTENDMPTVVSCNWLPNGVYSLYADPMPVAITDEMVERAYAEFMADKGSDPDGRTTRQALRDTLYAALASKPEGER